MNSTYETATRIYYTPQPNQGPQGADGPQPLHLNLEHHVRQTSKWDLNIVLRLY